MSETNLKPLIFLPPLSPTLEKLKEIMSENADAEGIEIIEVASIEEAIQVVPAMSQSLIMSASPKQCAMFLQSCRKHIKKLESKTILLSPKAIPGKTLEKFMKIGLTECVVEPVNPKTLLYKVRLQLRSIKVTKEEDMELKSSSKQEAVPESDKSKRKTISKGEDNSSEDTDQPTKERLAKAEEDEGEDLYHRKKAEKQEAEKKEAEDLYHRKKAEKQEAEDIDYSFNRDKNEEEEDKTHINTAEAINGHMKGDVDSNSNIQTNDSVDNTYKDDAIDGHLRGDNQKDSEDKDKGDKSSYQEDAISGHYKGQVKDKVAPKEKEEKDKTLEEEIAAAKEEIRKQSKKELGDTGINKKEILLPEDKEAKRSNFQEDDLGGNYEGQMSSEADTPQKKENTTEAEKALAAKKDPKQAHELEEDSPDHNGAIMTADDLGGPLMGDLQSEEKEEPPEKERAAVEAQQIPTDQNKKSNYQEDQPTNGSKGSPADEIGGPQVGKASTDNIDDTPSGSMENQEALSAEPPSGAVQAEKEIDGYLRGGAAKKEEQQEDDKNNKDGEAELEDDGKNKKPTLRLEDDSEDKETANDDSEALEDDKDSKNSLDLEDEEDAKKDAVSEEEIAAKKREGYQEEEIDNNWSDSSGTDTKEDKHNKSNAKSDHLSTHYSNKQGTAHNEDNYGRDWKALREDEEPKVAKEREVQAQKEKEALDEQTINYEKLKKEFGAIEYGSEQKDQLPYQMEAEAADIPTISKTILGSDGSLQAMSFEDIVPETAEEAEEGVNLSFYEPNPRGTDHVIHILQQYFNPNINIHAIYQNIALRIYQQSECKVVFYRNKQKQVNLIFNGYCDLSIETTSDSSDERLGELIQQWQAIEQEYMADWQNIKTPAWRDSQFKEQVNYFCFPYFEGTELYGIAIAYHDHNITDVQSEQVEILLESARGLYLNASPAQEEVSSSSKKASQNNEKSGFLGGFFKKVVGK